MYTVNMDSALIRLRFKMKDFDFQSFVLGMLFMACLVVAMIAFTP